MSENAEGEINAGGTLAATGLRYSSNELVFDTLYAIWREARSRNGPSRSISSAYVPLCTIRPAFST